MLQALHCHLPEVLDVAAGRSSDHLAELVVPKHYHAEQGLSRVTHQQVHTVVDAVDAF